LFQIGLADDAPGPFDSRRFAEAVAGRNQPAPAPTPKFRRIKIRGVRRDPDPEMRNPAEAATKARANSQTNFSTDDIATEPTKLQARLISRLYAVTFATAATIARLAYAVGAP
jgi:hypothetical protein